MPRKAYELITEDWAKEYEKNILIQKLSVACTVLSSFFAAPNLENLRNAYSYVHDYVTNLPFGDSEELKKKREGWVKTLDEINLILFGNPGNAKVQTTGKKYKITFVPIRAGIKVVYAPNDLVTLAQKLRDILMEAGDLAMQTGLRMLLPKERKFGMARLLEEEGIEELETGGEESE